MKKWLKITLFIIVSILIVSFIWFDLFFWQKNNNFFEANLKEASRENDLIIIFNSGGFGFVNPERAWDFKPLIEGIKKGAEDLGYKVAVVPYYRTEDSLLGKAAYLKEAMFNFSKESKYLANQLKEFSLFNQDKKIIIAGLSNGAAFTETTIKRINCCENNIFAVEFGSPFWADKKNQANILYLNNNGNDTLSQGNIPALVWSLIKAPFIMSYAKIIGNPISFPEAMNVPGHQYEWKEVGPDILAFMSDNLEARQ